MKQSDPNNRANVNKTRGLSGSCLCGGVRYRIQGLVRDVVNCYCMQCRKTSGHHVAATRVKEKDLLIDEHKTLRWYESTPGYKRGFCKQCGGNVFWSQLRDDQISVMAGTIDPPTGIKTVEHLYRADASDYFEIPNGVV